MTMGNSPCELCLYLEQLVAKDAELSRLRAEVVAMKVRMEEIREVVEDVLGCPITPDTATYNQVRGIDAAPLYQAVVMISCSWTRYKRLRNLDVSRAPSSEDGEAWLELIEKAKALRTAIGKSPNWSVGYILRGDDGILDACQELDKALKGLAGHRG
jgi:hypothetical protein